MIVWVLYLYGDRSITEIFADLEGGIAYVDNLYRSSGTLVWKRDGTGATACDASGNWTVAELSAWEVQ